MHIRIKYYSTHHVNIFRDILAQANVSAPEDLLPKKVLIYERAAYEARFYPYLRQDTTPEAFLNTDFGDLPTLDVEPELHRCFVSTNRLKTCRLERPTKTVYLHTDPTGLLDGGYAMVEHSLSSDFFEGGCSAFPMTIQNHRLANCVVDPNFERRNMNSDVCVGRDNKQYLTTSPYGIGRFYSESISDRAEVLRKMADPCQNLGGAVAIPPRYDSSRPFAYIVRPSGVLSAAISKKSGHTPLIYGALLSYTTLYKMAHHYLPNSDEENLAHIISESTVSLETINFTCVDSTYISYTTDAKNAYLVVVDASQELSGLI